jgi:hypothetical protein
MKTISTLTLLFALVLAGCTIKIFNGGGGDDDSRPSHPDAGARGSGGGVDAGVYFPDADIYDLDGGCSQSVDAGYYGPDAGCPGGFGSGGSGDCIE